MTPVTRHSSPVTHAAQPELPLDLPRGARPDLKEAYDKSGLAWLGITFDAALKNKAYLIGLTNIAQALATARIEG